MVMECIKTLTWLLLLGMVVTAYPLDDDTPTTDRPATTLEDDSDAVDEPEVPDPRNNFAFAFETENGQVRDENIQVEPASPPTEMQVKIKGSYSFISADGYEYTVFYKADKKGYRPYVTAHKIKDIKTP